MTMNHATSRSGWHVDQRLLRAYAEGGLDVATTWSVEAHLPACAECRDRVAALIEPERLSRVWHTVVGAIDVPRPGLIERLVMRLGVADHTARLLAATPSLRTSWLLSVVFTLSFAV